MEKNYENMNSKFLNYEKYNMYSKLYERLHELKHGGTSDLRAGSHPASLLSLLTKAGRSLNSFAILRKICLLSFPRVQGAKVKKKNQTNKKQNKTKKQLLVCGIIKREPGVDD